MDTVRVSKSAMVQRTGRAGRVASGICVRLYSKATSEAFDDVPPPGVHTGRTAPLLLRLRHLKLRTADLIDPVPRDREDSAVASLKRLQLLSASGTLTAQGAMLAKLGMGLRLGRFLLACDEVGCLGSGARLAALILSVRAVRYRGAGLYVLRGFLGFHRLQ